MQFLPLLGQDDAQLLKMFDEAGCQTSPPSSVSSNALDFMASFEELDEIISGFDDTVASVADDASTAPPPYSDAVTQSDASSTVGLGLDRTTLIPGSSLRPSATTPVYAGATMPSDDTLVVSQKIDHLLNPVPPGIYMRARPMIWDATPATYEAHRFGSDNQCPPTSAHPDSKQLGLPPWRRPSVAQVAFNQTTCQGDVFGPYTRAPASQFDTVPHHHVPRSPTYPPPPHRHPNPYIASDARIDPWTEHVLSTNTPLPAYAMPGTYPPSPPSTHIASSHELLETYNSPARCQPVQGQASLIRRTGSIHHGCESCYPSPPPSPSSSICTDSTYSSPSLSPSLDFRLSLHSHSHSPTSPHDVGAPAHTVCLSMPAPSPTQPSVVNISIALPSSCSSPHQKRFYHRISSVCAILIPFVFLIPLGAYGFSALLPPTRASSTSSSSSSLLHGPLIWRALSSLLSYVFRMMRDADVKI